MSYLQILFVLLILIVIGFFILKNIKPTIKKSAHVKKREIEQDYKIQMQELIQTFKNNEKELKEQRVKFIKNANYELSKNIFFTQEEIKIIIYELTIM